MAQRKADKDAAKVKAVQEQVKAEEACGERSFKAVALKWHEGLASGVDGETSAYILGAWSLTCSLLREQAYL